MSSLMSICCSWIGNGSLWDQSESWSHSPVLPGLAGILGLECCINRGAGLTDRHKWQHSLLLLPLGPKQCPDNWSFVLCGWTCLLFFPTMSTSTMELYSCWQFYTNSFWVLSTFMATSEVNWKYFIKFLFLFGISVSYLGTVDSLEEKSIQIVSRNV